MISFHLSIVFSSHFFAAPKSRQKSVQSAQLYRQSVYNWGQKELDFWGIFLIQRKFFVILPTEPFHTFFLPKFPTHSQKWKSELILQIKKINIKG